MPLSAAKRGERAGLLLRNHPGLAQRGFGVGAARIGVEPERERIGDGGAKVDRLAVVEHRVEVVGLELELLVARRR